VALAAERVDVGVTVGGNTVHGWAGPGLSLFAFGALLAGVFAGEGAAAALRRQRFGGRHLLSGVVVGVALFAAGGVLAGWGWQGWAAPMSLPVPSAVAASASAAPSAAAAAVAASASAVRAQGAPAVTRVDPVVLPGAAAAEAEGPAATRTLVLRVDGTGVRWSLLRAAGPRAGDDSADLAAARLSSTVAAADADIVLPVVGALLSDSGQDVRARLADLDIGSVVVLPPVDGSTALALDSAPGLVRVLTVNGVVLWRVELDTARGAPSRPSMVRLLSPERISSVAVPSSGAEVDTVLPSGESGRMLVLAERRDPEWQATLDGHRLVPVTYRGWAQAFELPAGGGRLEVRHLDRMAAALDRARATAAVAFLLLAIPLPRWRRRVALPPPRSSRPVRRGVGGAGTTRSGTAPARVFDEDYPLPDDDVAEAAPLAPITAASGGRSVPVPAVEPASQGRERSPECRSSRGRGGANRGGVGRGGRTCRTGRWHGRVGGAGATGRAGSTGGHLVRQRGHRRRAADLLGDRRQPSRDAGLGRSGRRGHRGRRARRSVADDAVAIEGAGRRTR
jgi:hypothetical protein